MQVESTVRSIVDSVRGSLQGVVEWWGIDPIVAGIVGAVLLVGVVAGSYRVWIWYTRPGRRLKRVLRDIDEATVLMHSNPDPDAMGAALGVAELAESVDTTAHLQYPGEIRHHENRAFRTVLNLDIDHVASKEDIAADCIILVDHNEPRGFEGCEHVTPTVVIDHHNGSSPTVEFADIRTDYGACASIVAEYLEQAGKQAEATDDPTKEISVETATGMLYGILSDTDHLTNGCNGGDFDACEYLYPAVEQSLLNRIQSPEVDSEVLEIKARAITERRIDPPYCISYVEEVSNLDAIPQAADELVCLEGISAVVVIGQKNGTYHLSGRSRDDRVHMGEALDRIVGDIPMSSAGGHARMGGGQVSAEHLRNFGPSGGYDIDEFITLLFRSLQGEQLSPASGVERQSA